MAVGLVTVAVAVALAGTRASKQHTTVLQVRRSLGYSQRQQLFSIMERSPPAHGTGANDDPFLNLNPPVNPAISDDGHYGEYDLYSDRDPPIYKKSGLAMLRSVGDKPDSLPGFIPTFKVGGDPLPGFIPTFKAPARRQLIRSRVGLPQVQVLNLDDLDVLPQQA